jgi:hypothetical protein
MAPETGPFWQLMAPEINDNLFSNLWRHKSPFPCDLWPQKVRLSGDFWFRIQWPEIAKMVQFLEPETASIWLFLDLFLKYLFFFSTWP